MHLALKNFEDAFPRSNSAPKVLTPNREKRKRGGGKGRDKSKLRKLDLEKEDEKSGPPKKKMKMTDKNCTNADCQDQLPEGGVHACKNCNKIFCKKCIRSGDPLQLTGHCSEHCEKQK